MSSWIATITADHPEHWRSAIEVAFWDITKIRDIRAGDEVFFWQSKKGLVGWTRVTANAVSIDSETEPGPWNDDRDYRLRFPFQLISDEPRIDLSWGEISAGAGFTELARNGQIPVPSNGEQFMRDLFATTVTTTEVPAIREDYPDDRTQVRALIHRRQGQPAFRANLRVAYGDTCAISGSSVTQILEAAHIRPYKGKHSHRINNGILMRSDLHTLFDMHLITLEYS